MKIIKKIALMMVFFASVNSYGQEILDAHGNVNVTIDSLGIITDGNNDQLGQFMPNGEIQDANGDVIGKIQGNEFKDANDDLLGSINISTGEVFDINKMKIGEIPNETSIKGGDGNSKGSINSNNSAVNKKRVAAYSFFFFNDGVM